MRIGITFDLRADYLDLGMSMEETAELDAQITITTICRALPGHRRTPEHTRCVETLHRVDRHERGGVNAIELVVDGLT
jgi:hypothetical protein